MKTFHKLIQAISPFIPARLREIVRSRMSLQEYDRVQRRADNPYINFSETTYPDSRWRFGIVEEVNQYHQHYIAACREMGVSYKVVDLLATDWVESFRNCACDAFLVWPSCATTVIKQVFDYRLRIMEHDLGMRIYPTWQECWLTEHKPRLRDWLEAHGFPHPRTWVFHERGQALAFARNAPLPIVVKTATGASASGVSIVRNRPAMMRIIRKAFGPGLRPRRYDVHDRQHGFVYLQEYLPDVEEWRMVRIGDSFFGYRKEKGPDGLHSASHKWSFLDPGVELLDLLKAVTDASGFTSMDVDIFRTRDGRLLVSECQTVFGCSTPVIQMKINDIEGRYVWTDAGWRFEPGDFCRNHMCNLRIARVINDLEHTKG